MAFTPFISIAACFPELVDYSLEAEINRSSYIVIATPIEHRWVVDKDEPDFYTGSFYKLNIHEVINGYTPSDLELYDGNHSGRFAPEIGKKYLFLLVKNSDGLYFADYCGNSGLLNEKGKIVEKIKVAISKKE